MYPQEEERASLLRGEAREGMVHCHHHFPAVSSHTLSELKSHHQLAWVGKAPSSWPLQREVFDLLFILEKEYRAKVEPREDSFDCQRAERMLTIIIESFQQS